MVPDLVTPADDIRAGGILVVDSLLDIATRFTRQ
jgi:hypothetical protein